jgi:hypothetical protein
MFRTKARFLKLNIRAIVQRLGKIDVAKELNFLLLRKGNSLMLRKCNIVNRTLMHSAVSQLAGCDRVRCAATIRRSPLVASARQADFPRAASRPHRAGRRETGESHEYQ